MWQHEVWHIKFVLKDMIGPCSLVQVRCYNICIYQDTDPQMSRTLTIHGLLHELAMHACYLLTAAVSVILACASLASLLYQMQMLDGCRCSGYLKAGWCCYPCQPLPLLKAYRLGTTGSRKHAQTTLMLCSRFLWVRAARLWACHCDSCMQHCQSSSCSCCT